MSILKKIPWFSLTLVFLSYSTLGWVIFEEKAPLYVRLITVLTILLSLISLTNPWLKLDDYSHIFFKSNARTFLVAILAAFLFFLMIAWFRVFLDTLLIICATILAKIDFQSVGLKPALAFGYISSCSLLGLGLGALINYYI
ncbi:hypothetical protein IQ226_10130 [Dolichospermum sp. LEGE 00240]|jgi:hypothetical protein|uniref:hypothetical protein n=1 Tax=Dolichospermum sp. LEGE 00240 TaxID=1828603 RepID=UPI0018830627|nr:hypothetical protein [Dolichospermum sp. LEGE 00240]MDM3843743.1 hypothetical protein [Aphanizomenon gracile PMC638.10]MDM3849536.1 hypothetical protein [Aphanizomenon gracile PMC627.10]MDM3858053.1 hypothetical protein [Aphanizomenon gracile PMC649.10]MDM3860561.1 hypothetical protein [Aphanizomenon gracile PMC644.10]MBE9249515.1 hypothetical protein [Dolichospermum sp. LEGE 00240]